MALREGAEHHPKLLTDVVAFRRAFVLSCTRVSSTARFSADGWVA